MLVQSLLRHAMAEAISEGFINCLIVTGMADANVQLTRIHEHLFARECFFVMLLTHRALPVLHFGSPFLRLLLPPLEVFSFPILPRNTCLFPSFLVGVVFA